MRKSPTAAWLFVEQGARAGATLRLEMKPVVLGRDPEAELQMDPHQDLMASGRHARISPSVRGWELRDLGSRNGTWVNGERLLGNHVLEPGDRVRLGNRGPVVLFTDRPPTARDEARRGAPRTVASGPAVTTAPADESNTGVLVLGVVGVVGVAAALAFWGGRAISRAPDAEPPPPGAAGPSTETPSPGPDTAAVRRDAEIDALQQQIREMREAFERSERESARLRDALSAAQRRGASDAEVDSLTRELQESNAARQRAEASMRLQQLAGSLDHERIERRAAPASAQLFVEFEGNETIAASAFGVHPRGALLTNKHVVRRSGRTLLRVGVQYAGRSEVWPARVAAVSPAFDLALIELLEPRGDLPTIGAFNERVDTLSVPAPVALIGFPLGGEGGPGAGVARPLVIAGVLIGRQRDTLELEGYGRVGASGSPILDSAGELVGVLMGGRTTAAGERLYAIPTPRAVDFLRAVSGSGG